MQRAEAVSLLVAATERATLSRVESELGQTEKEVWSRRVDALQVAIKEAQEASVNVGKAKRLLRELKACLAAAETTERLDKVLSEASSASGGSRQPGSGALKAVMSSADEAAATLAAACGTNGSIAGSASLMEGLKERMSRVRSHMAKKKASENLARTLAASKGVADLPKLESAIIAARKVFSAYFLPVAERL
jgi:hypothetical protein